MKVIGLTGTMGSGKNTVKGMILNRVNAYHVTLSDVIRGELERRKGMLNRMTLQDMGNEMRQKYGGHILALLAVEYLPRDKEMIIVDGLRHPDEVGYLKKKFGDGFRLIAVDAPLDTRFGRLQKRGDLKDPKNMEDFIIADKRDRGEGEPPYGQRVGDCVKLADFTITNVGSEEKLDSQVSEVLKQI